MLTSPGAVKTYRLKSAPPWLHHSLRSGFSHRTRFTQAEQQMYRRRKKISPSQWVERHRFITQGALAGHLMRLEVSPHIAGQIDAAFFPSVRVIVICAPPQTGKSTAVDSCHAYAMDMAPGPILSVYPDETTGKDNCKERIHAMINKSPRLRALKTGNKDDFAAGKVKLNSCTFYIGWAGSASSTSNKSIRYLDLQEVDKFPETPNKREGDTIKNAEARVIDYPHNHKIFISSTPTLESGPIWQALTKYCRVIFDYYVRCPFCGQEQLMVFERIKWPKGEDGHSLDPLLIAEQKLAWYECEHCDRKWNDSARDRAIQTRTWRERRADGTPGLELFQFLNRHRPANIGFHQSSWTSSRVSLSKVAADFLTANSPKQDPGDRRRMLKDFFNKHRAEPWMEVEATRLEEGLLALRDDRPEGIVPGNGRVARLEFGVDTQDDGFHYMIYAFGYGRTQNMWQVKDGFVESFEDLETVLWDFEYCTADGTRIPVHYGLIDARGHRTSEVYDWCALHPGKVLPAMGEQNIRGGQPYDTADVEFYPGSEKKKFPGALKRVRVNTTYYKDKLDGKLKVGRNDPGAINFHSEVTSDTLAQLCAEARDEKGVWQQIGNRANHKLDCTVLAMVAADMKGLRYLADPSTTESQPRPQSRAKQTQKRERW